MEMRSKINRTEKFWDRIAKQWDADGNKLNETSIKVIKKTKKHLADDDLVLEYGCGTGTISNQLAENVREIQGIDISSKMIEVAKRISHERNIENIHYAKSTIFNETYKPESFNAITAYSILHLVEDTPKVLRRINELLKPGGIFISFTPCLGERPTIFGLVLSILRKTRLVPHINMLTISELENLIAAGNFQIVETEILEHAPASYFIAAQKI
jgi:2-polyprenyl-3-methyl-5-hydroxy-6-metoxy-1,4-benzoquinol methylase